MAKTTTRPIGPPSSRKIAAPSKEYILDGLRELEGFYAPQDEQIRRMRAVRENEQPVPLDKAFRVVEVEVRDPTIADETLRVSASMAINPVKLHITPREGSGDSGQVNATKREHATEAILQFCGQREPGRDTGRDLVDAIVSDGGAWGKLLIDRDVWDERYSLRLSKYEREEMALDEEEDRAKAGANRYADDTEGNADEEKGDYDAREDPELKPDRLTRVDFRVRAAKRYNRDTEEAKKRAGPPFAFIQCDALGIYPVYAGGKLTEMFEVQDRPQLSTFRQYRLKRDKDGNIVPDELLQGEPPAASSLGKKTNPTTTVRFIIHTDETWITYVVEGQNNRKQATGQVVAQWKHRYGRVPYFYAPGLTMSHWKNRKIGWSVSESKRWLVEYRSFLWTLHAQVAARDALGPLVRKKSDQLLSIAPQDRPPEKKKAEHWNLREIIDLDPGEDMAPIQFAQVAASLKEQIALVSDAIEKLENPRVKAELGSGLEGAGFAIAQVLAEARTRFDPIAQAIERLYAEVTRFLWHLIRTVIGEAVWVQRDAEGSGFLNLGPDDVSDTVGVKWELNPERPTDKLVQQRYWHERLEKGTTCRDMAIEGLGDNPDEVRRGQAMDRIRAGAAYQKLQELMVFQEVGKGDAIALAGRATQIAQAGGLPGLGMGGPAAAGGAGLPGDMASMAAGPAGAAGGAMPTGGVPMGGGPPNGTVAGTGPGMVVPTQAAQAGAQSLVA